MKNSLIKIIQKEKFNPSIVGFFINQNFNIRRLLYQKIKKFAPEIKGKILDFGCGSKPYKHLFHNAKDYIGLLLFPKLNGFKFCIVKTYKMIAYCVKIKNYLFLFNKNEYRIKIGFLIFRQQCAQKSTEEVKKHNYW